MAQKFQIAIAGVLLAVGLIVVGFYINKGLQSFSGKERVVTVRGLAEQDIKAESAHITINISFSGDSPQELIDRAEKRVIAVANYLKIKGFEDVQTSRLNIDDSRTYYEMRWLNGQQVQVKKDRYRVFQTLTITVKEVEKVAGLAQEINLDLISKDLSSDVSTDYVFPELNAIKPELIAESTRNARLTGEQFAEDSQSRLGKIKTASQGQISIARRYDEPGFAAAPAEPYLQKVRVVSTIVFFLED